MNLIAVSFSFIVNLTMALLFIDAVKKKDVCKFTTPRDVKCESFVLFMHHLSDFESKQC